MARHEGRVVFVRYALPGERVRVRVVADRGSYWHADVVEVLEASPDRIDSLCPIAGVDGAGCCDLAFADPRGGPSPQGRRGGQPAGEAGRLSLARRGGCVRRTSRLGDATGWRTRVRLDVSDDGRAGFHRYHSAELVTDLRCGQLPHAALDGIGDHGWPTGAHLHVALDDDGVRHVVQSGPRAGRRTTTRVVEGGYEATQRVNDRVWHVPVTAFWQAHRDAARVYSDLVAEWAQLRDGMVAWDLYGGAGIFAAALGEAVGDGGQVVTVDTSRGASRSARAALADLTCVSVVTDSVRRAVAAQSRRADVAVLDPPRSGAGREVVELLAAAEVPRIIHIGCEAASFARDIGLYLGHGYRVEELRVFDSFPLTHHIESVAVLTR